MGLQSITAIPFRCKRALVDSLRFGTSEIRYTISFRPSQDGLGWNRSSNINPPWMVESA